MGLFSTVIHVRECGGLAVGQALDAVLRPMGFRRTATSAVGSNGPEASSDSAVTYAYGLVHGKWSTVIQVHVATPGNPWHADVAAGLSRALGTHVLSLDVHDDDILCYNLDYCGRSRDGYNSNLQYFEQERIAEAYVAEQRHTPEAFTTLLPPSVDISSLVALLDRGWWLAHDAGRLDEDGVPIDDDEGFVFEGERLTELGNLLQLHGASSGYPYSAWAEAPASAWEGFIQGQFARPNNSMRTALRAAADAGR